MKSRAMEEDSDGGTAELVKNHSSTARTELPSLASTRANQATQVEHTLAAVLLVGGTESVTVGAPGGAASTSF